MSAYPRLLVRNVKKPSFDSQCIRGEVRYPTFIDAVRDLDDAICCVVLGASLSQHRRIPKADLEDCARLAAEWQLYVTHTRALRKTFLSIKGIYYQAEVMGETVTWVAPYQFMQKVRFERG